MRRRDKIAKLFCAEGAGYGAQLRTGESIEPPECWEKRIPGLVLRTNPE
jgi:hypothetical protein